MVLPSLHRVPRGGFPCFCGTIQHSDFLPAVSSGFVAFAFRYHPSARLFCSRRGAGAASAAGRGVVVRVPRPGFLSVELTGPPRFLGDPPRLHALVLDPGGTLSRLPIK